MSAIWYQATLPQVGREQMRGEEKKAVHLGKGGEGRGFSLDQGATGPDAAGDPPSDKRLHCPSPYRW